MSDNMNDRLHEEAVPVLQDLAPASGTSSLRALMDYLCKLKETILAIKSTGGTKFPNEDEELDKLQKLALVVQGTTRRVSLVRLFIQEEETKKFWEQSFPGEYSTPTTNFVQALLSDPIVSPAIYNNNNDVEAERTLQDLIVLLDHYNSGHVVCHRLGDFVGKDPLRVALQNYKDKPHRFGLAKPLANLKIFFPLLIWIDNHPDNNGPMVEYAKDELGICVQQLRSTAAAKEWISQNPTVLEVEDVNQVHIITDNVRSGANTLYDLNAGEDIIRFVRGRRSMVAVLVYCRDLKFTTYTQKYKNCSAGNTAEACQDFMDELVPEEELE